MKTVGRRIFAFAGIGLLAAGVLFCGAGVFSAKGKPEEAGRRALAPLGQAAETLVLGNLRDRRDGAVLEQIFRALDALTQEGAGDEWTEERLSAMKREVLDRQFVSEGKLAVVVDDDIKTVYVTPGGMYYLKLFKQVKHFRTFNREGLMARFNNSYVREYPALQLLVMHHAGGAAALRTRTLGQLLPRASDRRTIAELVGEWGRYTARFHRQGREANGDPTPAGAAFTQTELAWRMASRAESCARELGAFHAQLVGRCVRGVQDKVQRLQRDARLKPQLRAEAQKPVHFHGDNSFNNVVFDLQSGRPVSFFDAEAMGASPEEMGPPDVDLAAGVIWLLIGGKNNPEMIGAQPELLRAFLDGYFAEAGAGEQAALMPTLALHAAAKCLHYARWEVSRYGPAMSDYNRLNILRFLWLADTFLGLARDWHPDVESFVAALTARLNGMLEADFALDSAPVMEVYQGEIAGDGALVFRGDSWESRTNLSVSFRCPRAAYENGSVLWFVSRLPLALGYKVGEEGAWSVTGGLSVNVSRLDWDPARERATVVFDWVQKSEPVPGLDAAAGENVFFKPFVARSAGAYEAYRQDWARPGDVLFAENHDPRLAKSAQGDVRARAERDKRRIGWPELMRAGFEGIVLDLDGTLTDENNRIPDEILDWLVYYLELGVPISIVTGRAFDGDRPDSVLNVLVNPLLSRIQRYRFDADTMSRIFRNFTVFADSGTHGYRFDYTRGMVTFPIPLDRYEPLVFSGDQTRALRQALSELGALPELMELFGEKEAAQIAREFGLYLPPEPGNSASGDGGPRINFAVHAATPPPLAADPAQVHAGNGHNEPREKMNRFMDAFCRMLSRYLAGRTGLETAVVFNRDFVDITPEGGVKTRPLERYLMDEYGIPAHRWLILADSMGPERAIDQCLDVFFGAVSVGSGGVYNTLSPGADVLFPPGTPLSERTGWQGASAVFHRFNIAAPLRSFRTPAVAEQDELLSAA